MAEKKSKKKAPKKIKVYECYHYEYDYDDLGKQYWCHNQNTPGHECNVVGRGIYCQQFCPGYKKGKFRGSWVISAWEKKAVKEFKEKMVNEAKEKEAEERALLKYLKEKYES
jgi:nicotinamide mononucleotide adenylyltransferase